MIHYDVSKTAQLAVSRGLAKPVAGSGVTVNSVLPGPTLSDGLAGWLEEERASALSCRDRLLRASESASKLSAVRKEWNALTL
jgi:NAD(P)-dependent dehydrogenase (short-subunit alcohol dehydrogenase family)